MKKYWFTLDMYIFIWQDENQILVYNSLIGKGYLYSSSPALKELVYELQKPANLYTVEIDEEIMSDVSIRNFIHAQKECFCGNLIDAELFPHKPITIIPAVYFNEEIALKDKKTTDAFSLDNMKKNLKEVFLQVTGECDYFCSDCMDNYKQHPWCHKNSSSLSSIQLQSIVQKLISFELSKVHILGGNIFSYPDWDQLLLILKKISCHKIFYINCKTSIDRNKIREILCLNRSKIKLLVSVNELITNGLKEELIMDESVQYVFSITNINEYNKAIQFMDQYKIEGEIFPYYNGNNQSFFQEYVYLNKEDILNTKWTRNQIMANQTINLNIFGKLIFTADGLIYSNINNAPIGDWKDNYEDIIHKELSNNLSWKKTRDYCLECHKCIFKYLCPPPSHYEFVLRHHNLCVINQ